MFSLNLLTDTSNAEGQIKEIINLECEQQQEGHHKTEKTHSFGQGEAQDSVWEQLLFEWWISGVANDEWTEHCSDSSTCFYMKIKKFEEEKKETRFSL